MDREFNVQLLLYGGLAALGLFELCMETLRRRKNGLTTAWRRAAENCGLTHLRWSMSRIGRESHLEGRFGALDVRFESPGTLRIVTRLRIADASQGALTLRRETMGLAVEKRFGAREVELGDPGFDAEIYVEGPTAVALAVLDAPTRPMVVRLLRGGIEDGPQELKVPVGYERGELQIEIRGHSVRATAALLPEALRGLLEAARRLSPPEDLPARLRDNLAREPVALVRLRTVITLIGEHPGLPPTEEALRAAVRDPDDEIRLQAATALGAEGREVLLDLASSVTADDSRSARAVRALGQGLPRHREKDLLQRALRGRRLETARACLETLGGRADTEAVDALAAVMATEEDELAAAAAKALGETGLPAAEGPLLAALDRGLPELRVAAARGLGKTGTVRAVPSLRKFSDVAGDGDLRTAARQAVAEIQSRASGAAPGQLSLAQAEAGQLSLAADHAGRLSLTRRGSDDPA
jgi:HEAT repeat protein